MSAATFACGPSGEVHAVATSTNNADIETFAKPGWARAFYVQCHTSNAWLTVDDTAPADDNGLEIIAGQQPLLIAIDPHKDGVQACSVEAAAVSQIKITWLA